MTAFDAYVPAYADGGLRRYHSGVIHAVAWTAEVAERGRTTRMRVVMPVSTLCGIETHVSKSAGERESGQTVTCRRCEAIIQAREDRAAAHDEGGQL